MKSKYHATPKKNWGIYGHSGFHKPLSIPIRKICIDCKRNTQQDSKTRRCGTCLTKGVRV